MKTLRLLLVVLMALLLPVRGLLAATAPCAGPLAPAAAVAPAGHGPAQADGPPCHQAADDAAAAAGSADHAPHGSGCHAGGGGACCLMPLAAAPPAGPGMLPGGLPHHPALVAPVAAFESGGPDRPPRAR